MTSGLLLAGALHAAESVQLDILRDGRGGAMAQVRNTLAGPVDVTLHGDSDGGDPLPKREQLAAGGGSLPLPMIRNDKTVDPRDKHSPAVIQLETAMGAAIECFEGAAAIEVPRSRFAPVKTTADLLALRSDAYEVLPGGQVRLHPSRGGRPPVVTLPATSSEQRSSLSLRGHGLNASWQGPAGLVAKLTWSHRDGHNPKPTQTGTDGEGTLRLNRFWFTTSLPF